MNEPSWCPAPATVGSTLRNVVLSTESATGFAEVPAASEAGPLTRAPRSARREHRRSTARRPPPLDPRSQRVSDRPRPGLLVGAVHAWPACSRPVRGAAAAADRHRRRRHPGRRGSLGHVHPRLHPPGVRALEVACRCDRDAAAAVPLAEMPMDTAIAQALVSRRLDDAATTVEFEAGMRAMLHGLRLGHGRVPTPEALRRPLADRRLDHADGVGDRVGVVAVGRHVEGDAVEAQADELAGPCSPTASASPTTRRAPTMARVASSRLSQSMPAGREEPVAQRLGLLHRLAPRRPSTAGSC